MVSFTERYQFLEKLSDNTTRSTIIVHIPGVIGAMTKVTLGDTINQALAELNHGIKVEAERNIPHREAITNIFIQL